jgi:hypothetical protein
MKPKTSLLLYLVTLLVSSFLQAQDDTGSTDKEEVTVTRDNLRPWAPEYKARVARAFQYQLGLQEQPGTATIQNGSTVQFIPNPERYLIRHSLTFQFSELFLTPSDFGGALRDFYVHNSSVADKRLNLSSLCGKRKQWALECVATSGAWWQRALSGLTMTFSLSERTRVVSGIVVPDRPFPQDYDKAGQIDFDPSQIFITGADWKNAATSLKDMKLTNNHPPQECSPDGESPDGSKGIQSGDRVAVKCVNKYGGSKWGGVGFLAAAVPKFKFARQTQFDFLKNGGALVPAPFPESALNSYTFTWDLKHLIAPTKERIAVADFMKDYTPKPGTKLCVTIINGHKSYLPISDSFPAASCQRFAHSMEAETYEFRCVAKDGETFVGDESHKPTQGNCKWE